MHQLRIVPGDLPSAFGRHIEMNAFTLTVFALRLVSVVRPRISKVTVRHRRATGTQTLIQMDQSAVLQKSLSCCSEIPPGYAA